MRVTLVVPGLAAAAKSSAPCRDVLARIAALAEVRTLASDLDGALVADGGLGADGPVAPIAALGAGFDPGSGYVLRADPVALVAGRDDVLLAGRIEDLDEDEADALRATLAAHFADDGLSFHLPRPDAWFVTARASVPVATTPLAAIAGPIHPFLPQGPHGATWRRWMSEMQMLLHDHAVNITREAQGLLPVTGIWIAGGGSLPRESPPRAASTYATAHAAGDVARGLAALAQRPAHVLPEGFASLRDGAAHRDGAGDDAALVVLDPLPAGDDDAAARAARNWLDPACAALVRGAFDALVVIGDGGDGVQRWSATPPSLLGRLRARLRRPSRGS